jgi:hypothetical protein
MTLFGRGAGPGNVFGYFIAPFGAVMGTPPRSRKLTTATRSAVPS